jgi:hypothetical protein
VLSAWSKPSGGDWLAAHQAFASASAASDLLLVQVLSGVHGFDDVVRGGHESGELDAFALAQLGRLDEAVDAVERDRTRWMTESLGSELPHSHLAKTPPAPGHAIVYLLATPWGGLALAIFGPAADEPATIESCPLPELTYKLVAELIQVSLDDGPGPRRIVGGYGTAQEGIALNWLVNQWPGDTFVEKAASLHSTCTHAGIASALDQAAEAIGRLRYPGLQKILQTSFQDLDDAALAQLAATLGHAYLQIELGRCSRELSRAAMKPLTEWILGHRVTSMTLIPCGPLPAFPLLCVAVNDLSAMEGSWTTVADRVQATIAPSARSLAVQVGRNLRSGLYALWGSTPDPSGAPLGRSRSAHRCGTGRQSGTCSGA